MNTTSNVGKLSFAEINANKSLKDLPGEIWKDIKGYEGFYMVSNMGRVKSLERITIDKKGSRRRLFKAKVLKTKEIGDRYPQKSFTLNGKQKVLSVHRLVADAFLPNPDNKREVNHINGVKTDNRVENLEWATPSENCQHAYDTGLQIRGEKRVDSKLTRNQVIEIRHLYENKIETQHSLSLLFKVSRSCIEKIVHYNSWKQL